MFSRTRFIAEQADRRIKEHIEECRELSKVQLASTLKLQETMDRNHLENRIRLEQALTVGNENKKTLEQQGIALKWIFSVIWGTALVLIAGALFVLYDGVVKPKLFNTTVTSSTQ